jgi:hypothetical protein
VGGSRKPCTLGAWGGGLDAVKGGRKQLPKSVFCHPFTEHSFIWGRFGQGLTVIIALKIVHRVRAAPRLHGWKQISRCDCLDSRPGAAVDLWDWRWIHGDLTKFSLSCRLDLRRSLRTDRHLAELEHSNFLISLKQKCLHPSFLTMPHLSAE